MKLSISNIAWGPEQDTAVYDLMKKFGFFGLEIAPSRIIPEAPYDKPEDAGKWSLDLRDRYGFSVSSMQSIWFGREEKIFGPEEERQFLLGYTKKAIDFAGAVRCGHLVFGCPRNRQLPESADPESAVAFFKELGDYAAEKGAVIGMEANPPIYNTNYVNDTASALELIRQVNSGGFLLNLDVGAMIENGESVDQLKGSIALVHHVHISEPGLRPIGKRKIHEQLRNLLLEEEYGGFVSIEMGRTDDLRVLESTLAYVKEIFGS